METYDIRGVIGSMVLLVNKIGKDVGLSGDPTGPEYTTP